MGVGWFMGLGLNVGGGKREQMKGCKTDSNPLSSFTLHALR